MKVLIINDSPWEVQWVVDKLSLEHEVCAIEETSVSTLHITNIVNKFDVIVLDIYLHLREEKGILSSIDLRNIGSKGGIFILKKIRKISNIPIIIWSKCHYSEIKNDIKDYENVYFEHNLWEVSEIIRNINK